MQKRWVNAQRFSFVKDCSRFFTTNVVQNDVILQTRSSNYTCLILLSPASQFLPSQTNLYS